MSLVTIFFRFLYTAFLVPASKTKLSGYIFMFAVTLAFLSSSAYAYVGPGLGVALVWTLFGPIVAIISAVLMIAYFPARYYYKKYKHKKKQQAIQDQNKAESSD